ncbi:1-acylglycerol-3-phosphate O-acyltransferase Pnpla3-like [Daphnia pulex]|uniref:1-acylglycerol-3-phosphate O-acyltransferase Pnpla3-like n=1 Tax=Daphnia pulex TaxID=6669 RepID=UPI001EDE3D51|nr:1-acylglycerol-3-phosphate O-acyltransferase Pnpla3-like [Daphnia pulex]XP_046648753.1 1-acylglycerol-3-phosphate O-acyltransferase Pnpla3-like isoform X1 [Daphnia pulicaria]
MRKMNLSFAGCGFMGIYHVGVAACLRKYAPDLYLKKVSGASAGAIAAACLLCDAPLGEITSHVLQVAMQARSRMLGPFSPSFDIHNLLRNGLQKNLPDDAHLRVNGKIHISVTRVYDGKNVILKHFETKDELIQAIACSCFIPFFSGMIPPKFRGVRYMDGGLSDNLLVLDEHTITVSPFCGESDICPRDKDTSRLIHVVFANTSIELSRTNLYRLAHIMFPPKPETLSKICQQGFDDARVFLQQNNLVVCYQCVSTHKPAVTSSVVTDIDCLECESQKKMVVIDRLPETVSLTLQNAITEANQGVMNWIFRHRGMRLLSILSLPYVLPVDVVYATFLKFADSAPTMSTVGTNLKGVADSFVAFFFSLIMEAIKKRASCSTRLSCQLAVTEFSPDVSLSSVDSKEPAVKNHVNFGFTFNLESSHESQYSSTPFFSDDSFDEILALTARHDALMAHYFLDEKNQVDPVLFPNDYASLLHFLPGGPCP